VQRGTFCISIDLELGWGIWDRPSAEYFELCARKERFIVSELLATFSRYEIPATWAVVGRLLVSGRAPVREGEHGERLWYAPDIVDAIRSVSPAQDIGSHGYEHLGFYQVGIDRVRSDLEAAREVHAAQGLDFTSFVFPRNEVGHIEVLREMGIRVFRGLDQGWHMRARHAFGARAGRIANLLDKLVPVPPLAVFPKDHGEIRELPGSMLLLGKNGARRLISRFSTLAKAQKGLQAARTSGGSFHLWFHPSNFYYQTQRQLDTLRRIVALASTMRERGELDVVPMSGFAAPQTVSLSR
jgi:peptidoglycan/xylan/chitin deacetylase (PgdA/CDA1 family)